MELQHGEVGINEVSDNPAGDWYSVSPYWFGDRSVEAEET